MDENDIIEWSSNNFLTWADFKAEPNPAVYQDALSKIRYHYTWTLNSEKIGKDVFFFIENINLITQFLKQLSWVREKLTTEVLLRHQQGFFDLAEEMRPQITQLLSTKLTNKPYPTRGTNETERKQFAREDSGLLIKNELDKLYGELFLKQAEKYEIDTEYGENESKQQEYDSRFKTLR